jgi:alkylation response protein AidB-like acyl-CoA dehydrogenase
MNVRTATVLEVDQDVQTARNAARGILAAASNLRAADAADAGDLPVRVKRVAAIAAEHAAAVDRDSAAARAERLLGIAVPRELGGEGASIAEIIDICYALGRACGVDRDDLCDAPDQGCLPGPSWPEQPLVSAFAAPARQRATLVRILERRGIRLIRSPRRC